MNKTSILAETLAEIQEIKEGLEKNANHILKSTLKEDLEAIVRKGLNESEEEETLDQTDDMVGGDLPTDGDGEEAGSEEMTAGDDMMGADDTFSADGSDTDTDMTEPEVIDLTNKSDDEVIKHFNLMTPADEIEVIETPEGGIQININPSSKEGEPEMGDETGEEPTMGDETGEEPMMGDETGEETTEEPGEEEVGEEPTEEPGEEEDDEKIQEETGEPVYEIEIADEEIDEATTTDMDSEKHMKSVDEEETVDEVKRTHMKPQQHMQNVKAKELQESLVTTRKKIQGLMAENKQNTKELQEMASLVKEFKTKEVEYKSAIKNLKGNLQEVALFTSNLSYIVKLLSENTTTKDEKLDIIKRFDKANNLSESREIYNSLNSLLNESKKSAEKTLEEHVFKNQKTSGASTINESTAYKNPQLERMLDMINKMK
jgi:hypothetical protein